MNSIRLPCHKGIARRPNSHENNATSRYNNRRRPGQIPYVSHDNGKTRYYADRYYIDAPTALLEYQLDERREKKNEEKTVDYCNYCGEKRQPSKEGCESPARPLFDRAAFINSLDLTCAIIATYTIGDLEFLSDTFPSLFPDPDRVCKNHVPTLVLHGHRGWKLPTERRATFDRPDEWDVERDEADCDLDLDTANDESNEKKISTSHKDSTQSVPAFVAVESEACTETCVPNTSSSNVSNSRKDGVNIQSSTKDEVHIPLSSTKYLSPDNIELTYGGQTLDIRSSSKKRKRKKFQAAQSKTPDLSPRRSPRLSPTKYSTMSPDTQNFSQSPRRSPRLNPCIKMSSTQEDTLTKGSTPMDAIELDSDTEDDECNNYPAVVKREDGASHNSLSHHRGRNTTAKKNTSISMANNGLQSLPPRKSTQNKSDSFNANQDNSVNGSKATRVSSVASILKKAYGSVQDTKLMTPLNYTGDAGDSSDEDSDCDRCPVFKPDKDLKSADQPNREGTSKSAKVTGAMDVSHASVFSGEVFFTQVLPRWIPPKDKKSSEKKQNEGGAPVYKTVIGCHHPKYFLLFEKSGSLVVIISTCNLTPQHAVDASWVQRFEPRRNLKSNNDTIDYGMTHDFGYVLTDLIKRQSEAADGGMLPDAFLRRFVNGLSSGGLSDLPRLFKFEDSHVHLVSTVPGNYMGHLPKKGVASCYNRPPYRSPTITYGPQRVAYVLSRVLDKDHINVACATIPRGLDIASNGGQAAVTSWLPSSLLSKAERLVIQPTSMSGTWDRWELELVAKSILEPYWKIDSKSGYNSPVDLVDIIWPTMDHFDSMRKKRKVLNASHQAKSSTTLSTKSKKNTRGPCHVFLSSVAFSKLDRLCISRMALFEPSKQPHMKSYESTSLHFKSFCRMLKLDESRSKEHIAWFMLTSACLSKGAQGQPTPYRSLDSDSMSYANFELGVLFCSRILGDRLNDRVYVNDNEFSGGCQCGSGKRWYKDLLKKDVPNRPPEFLNSVRKIHLPIPYQLRPKPYQQDPDSDCMSFTPYLHEILPGTGAVGNMKLTPYGRNEAINSSPTRDATQFKTT